ncbi:MAG TPA: DUF3299 domain-containing protein [Rhodocyclaceae bacterium]|nr:DUF3299 domain-containing protein [Rhodocyclaceae bacterium]
MRNTYFVFCLCVTALLTAGAQAAAGKADSYRDGERLAQPKSAAAASDYKEITWEALIPADWDPMKAFKKLDLAKLKDSDPKAMEAMEELKAAWNAAPVEPKMDGVKVRIPGFVVPLGTNLDRVKEFLLVPYFGACIHVPPPPANQMIHVFPKKPLRNAQIMGTVWVSGTLKTTFSDTSFGAVGYRMQADGVEPYKE